MGASLNPKLTALPQYETRASVSYFAFFFFLAFFAMVSILVLSVEPAAG
jgi:hypothetical protein